MRLAVSNIAWDAGDDPAVAIVLRQAGIDAIEVAPTKAWPNLRAADARAAREYRDHWRRLGLEIVATQSLLFGQADLRLFDEAGPDAFVDYLSHVLMLGAALGARAQVFGSPHNRRRESLPAGEAFAIAVDVFGLLALRAEQHGTALCLEANPPEYGADFLTSTREAAAVVQAVDRPGLRLHLDTACMQLAGDDIATSTRRYASLVHHAHLSEPQLGPVGARPNNAHATLLSVLDEIGHRGAVSVEMRPTASPVTSVDVAARYAADLLPAGAA